MIPFDGQVLTFHSNHGPISYRFRDKRWFQSKTANFPTHVYIVPPLKGFPWNWVSALGVEKLQWWCYRVYNEVRRYLQLSGYNTAIHWQTDGHRTIAKTARQKRKQSTNSATKVGLKLFGARYYFMWLLFNGTANKVEYYLYEYANKLHTIYLKKWNFVSYSCKTAKLNCLL